MVEERRAAAYERIYTQLEGLIKNKSPNLLAAMSTIAAVLHAKLTHHSWTGFYFVAGPKELHVGPYQGPVACQILRDRGVCVASVETKQAVVVPDVHAFPGHIACDSRSMSEIVVPILKNGTVVAVLDIDSTKPAMFDEDDVKPLEKIVSLLQPYL
ncbi:MAG TPA: GAF domain-containing protein [Spirochaetia bacterium]|nr:GAF domain-containing protein [Spirochaetales bacterium]HRS66071.1 GAF domain-containing protein [Spirochaetia bacterium]HOT60501.1 GAF domain-containing protein [Spirochaetales bacterium]HQG39912.1 GAF domain-containing protein [Spirochaetales bacterium]HQK34800.1 GAF domain-containing protein [Spirochaetales bacterium]